MRVFFLKKAMVLLALALFLADTSTAQTPPGCTLVPSNYCTDCNSCPAGGEPAIFNNPDLMADCENLKIAFILDESGSIQNASAEDDVEAGTMVFLNALNCTGAEVAIIEFGDVANTPFNYTLVTDAFLLNVENNYLLNDGNTPSYNPQSGTNNSYTNWQAALNEVNMLSVVPDLVLFFTDGNPTAMFEGDEQSDGTERCSTFSTDAGTIRNAMQEANILKCNGAHMFVLGVAGASATNLQKVSGNTVLGPANDISTADYVISNSFGDLAMDLAGFANDLCPFVSSSIATCSGTSGGQIIVDVEDIIAANGYDYVVQNSSSTVVASGNGLNSDPLIITGLPADDYIIDIIITSGTAPNTCTRTVCIGETVESGANPDCSASNNGPITCANPSVTLNGGSTTPNVSFGWTGPNGFTSSMEDPSTTDAGDYTLTVTDQSGCVSVCFTTVAIDTTSNTTQLSATTCDPQQVGVSQDTLTNQAGCDSIVVTTTTLLTLTDAGADNSKTVCQGATVDLSALVSVAGGTFSDPGASGGLSGSDFNTTGLSGSFAIDYVVLSANACPNDTAVITVNVDDPADAGADNNTTVCQGTTVDLSALVSVAGGTFSDPSASGGLSGSDFNTTGLSGSYAIDYVVASGNTCPNDTAVITVNVDDPADAGADNNTTVCQGATVDLSALVSVAGGTFSDPGSSGGLSGSDFNTTGLSGSYAIDYVVASGNTCPNDTAVITVNVDNPADAGADNNTTVCQGTTVDLSALVSVAGGTFSDPGASGGLSGSDFNTTGLSGSYAIDYVVASGNTCPNETAVITVNVDDPADAGADNSTSVCDGDMVDLNTLVSVAGGTFSDPSASGGLSGSMFNTTGLSHGSFDINYVVTSGNTCPNDTAVITVGVNSLAGAGADNSTTVCQGTTVDLSALVSVAGGTFFDASASGGLSGSDFNTTGLSGSYAIDYVVASGNTCPNDTAVVTVNVDDPADAGADNNTSVCDGEMVDLSSLVSVAGGTFYDPTASGGLSGSMFNTTGLSPATIGLEYVVVSTNSCPNDTAIITVVVIPNSIATATGGVITCGNTSIQLDGMSSIPGSSFDWTGPGGFTSTDEDPIVSLPGIYTLTVNTQSNCPTSDTALVILNNQVPDVLAVGGVLDCISGDVQLQGSSTTAGVTYAWTGPAGFSSSMQNPVVTDVGVYTLIVTALNGCTASDTAQVDSDGGSGQSCPLIWSCAPDTTVTCTSSLDWQVIGGPDFQKDNCCAIQTAYASWTDSFSGTCPRILTRVWTAYDIFGNSESCTQTITIIDTVPPTLVGVPNDTTVHYTMVPSPAYVTAVDDCYNLQYQVYFNEQYIPTNDPKVFTVVRTWTAQDNCGNAVSATQTISAVELNATLSLNMMLEGPASVGQMTASLLSTGNLSATDPYGMGYTASASVMFAGGGLAPVDWVKVELRDPGFPKLTVDSMACILQSNGEVVDANGSTVLSFPNALAGNYYVVVDHYNHLGVMTASAYDLSTTPFIDFTSPSTPMYTVNDDAMKYVNGVMMLWMGDVTGDNIIKYTGSNNDRDPMLLIIGALPTNVVNGSFNEDTRLDGNVKYIGTNNDRDPILVNVGGNPTSIRRAQLP